ncbi:MAG: precorrin-2 C(20)-methyltransferase [Candidatus Methanofastidiosa archaeon]|jgi:precorrin-2/cobalt-factor-2 C20-methyltransferase|nr:precorrin-2 C(20)-methyltransferase [Candidatus Methanofastidiosa archaeon]HOM95313.1 precorrin-2 C(20)-methyltransferase [Methanofastidiosum sp.]HPC80764.1 precorrin-2 C(20)-methyltransferase [Methanofastidiosum sp.]HRS25100.1 precorrin-2 C(20)-methyltransferase [Methanofastidiosum sp.]
MKGKLYGIGVGPGDPDLITIKAVNTLKTVGAVISPESSKNKGSVAYEIAKKYLRDDVEIIYLTFPMSYEEDKLKSIWEKNANIIESEINKGKILAFITLGDPTIYSTYSYMLEYLKKRDIEIETIPGITSFCAICSRINTPLASGNETIAIIPVTKESSGFIFNSIKDFDNIVLMKPSANSVLIAEIIESLNLTGNFILAQKIGTKEEKISNKLGDIKNDIPYLSSIIIKKKGFID